MQSSIGDRREAGMFSLCACGPSIGDACFFRTLVGSSLNMLCVFMCTLRPAESFLKQYMLLLAIGQVPHLLLLEGARNRIGQLWHAERWHSKFE